MTKDLPAGELTIEPYGTSNYTVTAKGCDKSDFDAGNWDEIVCEDVAGTKDANGVTTITLDNPYAYRTSDNTAFTDTKLVVKFNGTKAYAHFEGKMKVMYVARAFEYTFGTDEGFDGGGSTGGGETGGETSSVVTVLENYTNDGNRFRHQFKIDWDKQKVVMSIDPTPCGNDLEHIVGLGVDCTQWNNALHVYNKYFDVYEGNSYNKQMLQAYFQTASSNNNTGVIDRKSPFSVEVSKEKEFAIDGEVKISASKMADLFTHADLTVGSGQGGDAASHAKYNYIKVVPLDWTEVPPVTVAETFTYDQDSYVGNNETSGTANVKVNKMTDGTYTMEIIEPIATKVGEISVGTDTKGRTTYSGEVMTNVESGVKYVVKGVVYEKDGANHLYMTLIGENNVKYVIGEDPDAPKVVATLPFENVAYTTSYNESGTATVTFTEMSDGTHPMTFVSEAIKATADNLTKGTDVKGRTTYTGEAKRTDTSFEVKFTVKAVVYGEPDAQKLYMTMDNGSGFIVTVGEDPDYVAPEPEIEGTVVEGSKNYAANGSKFEWSNIAINWNKQKLVAVIDLSSCTGTSENILSVGQNIGSWSIGGWHFYYTVASKKMKSDYLATDGAHPVSDPKTGVEPSTVRIELSKAEGCTIDGVSYNALYDSNVTGTWQSNTEDFWNLTSVNIGSKEGVNRSNAVIKYVTVVDLPVTVKEQKTFNEALYMVQGTTSSKLADATVEVKEMSDKTINMSLKYMETEYTSTELTKGTDDKNRTTYTGKVSNGSQTYDVAGVVYEKDNAERLYMTMTAAGVTLVVGENPDAVTPDPGVTEESNKTYTSNLRIFDGEEPVVENADAQVNIIKYSDESYKVTLKDVNILNKTQDLVFVGKALVEETAAEATEPLTIKAKSDEATTNVFGEQVNGTFEITEVSADEIKMGFVLNSGNFEYQGEFNYTDEETPEVYTNNLHIYDAAAPETDLFQADQAKVEFLVTETGGFKLTLKDVTLNEKTQDLVFTGMLPTTEPGGQEPLAEEGEGEVTPAEPAMVLNATADEATATFLGTTSATAVFNVIMNDEAETENDAFALTFTITAGEKTLAGEFNYEKTPDVEEYPINFDKTANSTHNSRALNSFSLQQTGKEKQTKSVKTSKAAYEDHTADEPFTVEAGSELTASFDYTGEWMHSFVYIDFDNDGQFSYKEGQWDQTGTDLVAFSFYSLDSNPKNDASGYNSVGDELTGDARNTYVAPSFKAPAKAGEYRIRFKFDWNCILPGGSSSILSDGGGVWDATLKVVEPVVDGISSINAEVANGEAQLFTIDGVKLNKLQKGLNIVRTADGKVKKVLVK